MVLPADARYPITTGNNPNKLLSPLAIALAREALERANAGLDVAGSADGGPPEFVLSRRLQESNGAAVMSRRVLPEGLCRSLSDPEAALARK